MMLDFFTKLGLATLTQFLLIFGIIIFFGLILFFLARLSRKTFVKTAGVKFDMFFTGWIGTPVHELGHAFFCLLFLHKIEEIQLFKPDAKSGTLGYVNHTYNRKNVYHLIGNFFIGIGPLLFGSFVLVLLIYFLLPENKILPVIFNSESVSFIEIADFKLWFIHTGKTFLQMFLILCSKEFLTSWQFWVFFYISFCIASHMELSPSDLKGAIVGLITIIVILILVNVAALLAGFDVTKFVVVISRQMQALTGLFIFASIMSAAGFIVLYFLLSIFSLIKDKKFINPFWG